MFANRRFQLHAAVILAASFCGSAAAQAPIYGGPQPVSNPGGFANTELQNIYRQDVGQGFSSASLNSLALNNLRARAPYFGTNPAPGRSAPRIGLGVGASPASKPFSTYSPEPTVSPYLNLFREDFQGNSDLNYNTLVQPMLQQQQFNRQVQRQSMEMARRLQSMAAQSDFNPQGSKQQYPTGHQTVFMYYGHYYPTANARPRR